MASRLVALVGDHEETVLRQPEEQRASRSRLRNALPLLPQKVEAPTDLRRSFAGGSTRTALI